MNNASMNHYTMSPISLEKRRSKFDLSHDIKTTFRNGRLHILDVIEVLPGDTFTCDINSLVRMATPKTPVMSNAFLDVFAFHVPNRLTWNHWKQFMGESDNAPWINPVSYTIPQIISPNGGADNISTSSNPGWAKGSVGDMLGIRQGTDNLSVSALPFRGYALIWNNYFRDQNTMTPVNVYLGDNDQIGTNNGVTHNSNETPEEGWEYYIDNEDYVVAGSKGGILPVCRLHDRYSSCLPSPQRGPVVTIPISGFAPVVNDPDKHELVSLRWYNSSGQGNSGPHNLFSDAGGSGTSFAYPVTADSDKVQSWSAFTSLKADLSGGAISPSIVELRNAVMTQQFYETLARGGSRYFEMIPAFFGVTPPDSTVQVPEFLGGRRIPINMTQVAQTGETATTPQGTTAAYSLTTDSHSLFTKSFTEHGYIILLCCARTEHSYSQGIPRHLSRKTLFDFFNPAFAHTSEQPVYNKEIYAAGTTADDEVFGYQEAWFEYRSLPNKINGEFSPDYAQSLDVWHYGDDFDSCPTLSPGFLVEPATQVDRTLAVTSHDQYIADFWLDMKAVRPMPVYSVPGINRI